MPSQARRHTRNVRNQATHLFAKANRLARKVERSLHPSMFTNGNLTATERDIASGVHGDWRRMVYLAARAVSDKGETAWFNTPECPAYEPTAPALHRAERRRLLQDGDLEYCSYTDTTHGFLNSSACV